MSGPSSDTTDVDRRRFLKATGAGAVVASLAGCQGGQPAETPTPTATATETPEEQTTTTPGEEGPPEGGILTVGLPNPPKGLNALATSSSYSWAILDYVHGWGTSLDPFDFKVHPSVYTDWTVQNVDSGKPDVYFSIRDGITFNNGQELSVDDVLFTYNYMMEQKPGRYISTIRPITTVEEAGNEYDLHMKLNKPVGTYEVNQLALPILSKDVWQGVDQYSKYTPGDQVPDRPVGLGPGRVTKYAPDTAIEITFRDDYQLTSLDWVDEYDQLNKGGPFINKLRFKVFTSATAMNQAFLQGNLDALYGSIRTANVDQVKQAQGQKLIHGGDTGYSYIGYNLRRPPLDDLPFRQALSFLWDDIYWVRRLNQGLAIEGDFVVPPGYAAARPETGTDVSVPNAPESQAFHFRSSQPGVPNYSGIRKFLTEGKVITGEGGTYVGKDYPGSITGVQASQTEPRHSYSFGSVQSQVLKDFGANQEIRVDGQTIPELLGSPLTYMMYPPQLVPNLTEMDKQYTQNLKTLGIPIERKVLAFNPLVSKVYATEDFDIYHMGWGNTSPFGISSLYSIFHSDNADDHSVKEGDDKKVNDSTLLNNATGYGLFDYAGADQLISDARQTMDTKPRQQKTRKAVERIYLDQPYQVYQYEEKRWPVNSAKFAGFIGNIPGPGQSNLATQILYGVHQKQ
ncbi:MAG: ABC transporter substrate-binding protein [Halodesulfurarchaeum sp.]